MHHAEPQAGEDTADGRVEVVPARVIEAGLHVGVLLQEILVTGSKTRPKPALLGCELAGVRRRAPRMPPDSPSGVREPLLLEEADARAPGERDIPRIRRLETRRDPQERRLANAVWANETNAVTVCEAERNVAEDQPLAEPFRDRLDREDAHSKTHHVKITSPNPSGRSPTQAAPSGPDAGPRMSHGMSTAAAPERTMTETSERVTI